MKKPIRNLSCRTCPRNQQKRLWTGLCQACYKIKMRHNSVKFKLCTTYQGLKSRCKDYKDTYYYGMEYCTKDEFISKFETDKTFLMLFKTWKKTGRKMNNTPSIDRIDNKKGYLINNLQFITHSQNCGKDRDTTPVMVIKDEKLIGTYYSLNEAIVDLGVQQSNAWKVLHYQRQHTCGYIFERIEDE